MLAAGASLLPAIGSQPIFGYGAALLLIVAAAIAIPGLLNSFVRLSNSFVGRLLGVEAMLALRSLRASLGRTSVLIGALATAVAMMASVGIMVGSFRETVALWMDNQLKADFYLRPAGSAAADRHPTMSPDVADTHRENSGHRRRRSLPRLRHFLPRPAGLARRRRDVQGCGECRHAYAARAEHL